MPSQPQVLIITGASRGIRAATAKLAATRGFHVCVNYLRQKQAAEEVAATIKQQGGKAVAIQADVTHLRRIIENILQSGEIESNRNFMEQIDNCVWNSA